MAEGTMQIEEKDRYSMRYLRLSVVKTISFIAALVVLTGLLALADADPKLLSVDPLGPTVVQPCP